MMETLHIDFSDYTAPQQCVTFTALNVDHHGHSASVSAMGRRNYILFDDWDTWLRQLAETGGI